MTSVFGLMVLGLGIVLACPRPALSADATELIREGVALRRQGDDLAALQKFQQAFQIDKSPRAVAQMGLAEQALGRWAQARDHLTQALEAKADPWVVKNRTVISDALNLVEDHVGKLEILGGSANAEVRIDGVLRGTLPLPRPLTMSTGAVTIDLSAPGHVPLQRTTMVRARQTIRESFDPLAPLPGRDSPAAAVTPTATKVDPASVAPKPSGVASASEDVPAGASGSPDGSTPPDAQQDVSRDTPSALRSSAKWIAWGLGGAAAGLGIFGLLQQNSAADDFDSGCGLDASGAVQPLPGSPRTVEACRGFKNGIDSNFRLEVIGFVGAAVFAGTGLALWLTEPKPREPRSVATSCLPDLAVGNGLWIRCNLRF